MFSTSLLRRNGTLEIKLRESNFAGIPDNKRNAHKVVAAKLQLVIPENLQLEVVSDVLSNSFNPIMVVMTVLNFSVEPLMVTT